MTREKTISLLVRLAFCLAVGFFVLPLRADASSLAITTATLPGGATALPYSGDLNATGGMAPYSWSIVSGTLPPGLGLNAATGAISGTPTATGPTSFVLQLADSGSPQQVTTRSFTVSVAGPEVPDFNEYLLSGSARSIASGPDGALWFTDGSGNNIGRITTTGAITEFPIPTAVSGPVAIAPGPDGALWFTEQSGNKIGRITTAGVVTESSVPTTNSYPSGIAAGPDGALWFTENSGNAIGRITTAGVITEFPIPTVTSSPSQIVLGTDGALWFTEQGGNNIGRITTAGVITEFAVPTRRSYPAGIAAGPDGALWFTENSGNAIGRITTPGVITEFPIPTMTSSPGQIVPGPDGALWFTEQSANQIGRITTAGAVSEYSIPTLSSFPGGIALGSDGALWFTEALDGPNKIGRVALVPQLTLTCPFPEQAQFGIPYDGSCSGAGGITPYSYSISTGVLPPGLNLNSSTGAVGGTPTALGTFSFTIGVTDSGSLTATEPVDSFTVVTPIFTITTTSLPNGTAGVPYSTTLAVRSGTPPYTWSLSRGTLPAGLTLSPSGTITGTPTAAGNFPIVVSSADSSTSPQTTAQALLLYIAPPLMQTVTPAFSIAGIPATQSPETTIKNASVTLSAPVALATAGTLKLSFAANAADLPSAYMDPNLQFLNASSKTTYNLTVPAGVTSVPMPEINPGTVAGSITVTFTVGGQQVAASTMTVEPVAPIIASVQIVSASTGFDVEIVASSTPRDMTNAVLTFTPAVGVKISGSNIVTLPVSSLLAHWYSSVEGQSNGSLFTLTVPFTISGGGLNYIQSVTVTLSNSVGTSTPVTGTPGG